MKVILAQPRGFCAGVVRAVDIVETALSKYGAPVYVRHEIVHNRHVVESLRDKGAIFVKELSDIPPGAITIFSAHGVSKAVEAAAERRNLPVIDATCPLVSKVHMQGRRYLSQGRTLILVGHAGHPEVEGTMGQFDEPVILVQTVADVSALDLPEETPVAYITQTTLSVDDTRAIIQAIHSRFRDVSGPEVSDICYATQNRQAAVRELAGNVDVLLVVGAKNSSNSNRLREIGEEAGIPSYLLADGAELELDWVRGAGAVGLTAGASAPEISVQSVIDALRQLGEVEVASLPGVQETIEFRLPAQLREPEFEPKRTMRTTAA
jgi:4-hydroxy-3-methylbut-2-en-1-yl diphosphate reductase